MKIIKSLLSFALICIFTGCATYKVKDPNTVPREFRLKDERNYTVNIETKVNTGEAIVKRRRYSYYEQGIQGYAPDQDVKAFFSSTIPPSSVAKEYFADYVYRTMGTTEVDGKEVALIPIGTPSGTAVTPCVSIDTKSLETPTDKVMMKNQYGLWQTAGMHGGKLILDPPGVRWSPRVRRRVSRGEPFESYELIYTGKTKDTISLLYREYTTKEVEEYARAAFFQNLTYELNDGGETEISFKQIKIVIKEATNNSITYRVIQD